VVKDRFRHRSHHPAWLRKLTLKVESKWGEPWPADDRGSRRLGRTWTYEFANVPAFNNMKVAVSSEGAWNTIGGVAGEKGPFELKPGTGRGGEYPAGDH